MKADIPLPIRGEAQKGLSPREPPAFDEFSPEEQDWVEIVELTEVDPHNFADYCECSRRLGKLSGFRPTFIGYAIIPRQPLGVCH